MKAGALVGLLLLALGAFVVLLRPAPRSGPEPLRYGRDACTRCRMLLGEPGFAGEMRDAHGQLTRYDDIGCLIRALQRAHGETPEAWVEDHASHRLVPLLRATLVSAVGSTAGQIRTPMGYGIVAFADPVGARAFAASHGARVVALEELLRTPEELAGSGKTADQEGSPIQ